MEDKVKHEEEKLEQVAGGIVIPPAPAGEEKPSIADVSGGADPSRNCHPTLTHAGKHNPFNCPPCAPYYRSSDKTYCMPCFRPEEAEK